MGTILAKQRSDLARIEICEHTKYESSVLDGTALWQGLGILFYRANRLESTYPCPYLFPASAFHLPLSVSIPGLRFPPAALEDRPSCLPETNPFCPSDPISSYLFSKLTLSMIYSNIFSHMLSTGSFPQTFKYIQ